MNDLTEMPWQELVLSATISGPYQNEIKRRLALVDQLKSELADAKKEIVELEAALDF